MRNYFSTAVLCLFVTLGLPAFVMGADDAQASAEEFPALFEEWNAKVESLGALYKEFQTADPERRGKIAGEYREVVTAAEGLLPRVAAAAELKLLADKNGDSDEAGLLQEYVLRLNDQDNYEEAARLAKLLTAQGIENAALLEAAGNASFAIGDFAAAEEYYTQAAKDGSLGNAASLNRSNLAYYKKLWQEEQKFRTAEAQADDLPRVLMKTSKGDLLIELFENEAPKTIGNFVSLVEDGYYNGLTFHRVLPGFMAQGGCPNGTGTGGPGYNIPCECVNPVHRNHFRGSLSMAHAGPNTGGSQFFLNFVPTKHLDGRHTVFGRVIEGFDVLSKLQRRDPGDPSAPEADKIITAKVVRKRDHEYKPTKS